MFISLLKCNDKTGFISKFIRKSMFFLDIEDIFQDHLGVSLANTIEDFVEFMKIQNSLDYKILNKYYIEFLKILEIDISKSIYFDENQEYIVNLFKDNILIKFQNKKILVPFGFLKYLLASKRKFDKECEKKLLPIFILAIIKSYFSSFVESLRNYSLIFIIAAVFFLMHFNPIHKVNYFLFIIKDKFYFIEIEKFVLDKNINEDFRKYMHYCDKNINFNDVIKLNINYLLAMHVLNKKS